MKRVPCTACAEVLGPNKRFCPECRGVGFFEIDTCPAGKDWFKVCPLVGDAMTGGWECPKCGGSGPMPRGD